MKTYRYTSPKNTVVAVIDEDGKSRMSMLASEVPQGAPILPYVAPPTPVPEAVSMRQARLALDDAGLLDGVDAAIAAIPDLRKRRKAKIDWEYAQEVQRHHGLVPVMAQALGMTEAQLDALFIAAESL